MRLKNLMASLLASFAIVSVAHSAPQKSTGIPFRQPNKVTQGFCDAAHNANLQAMQGFLDQGANINDVSCYLIPPKAFSMDQHKYTDGLSPLMHSIVGDGTRFSGALFESFSSSPAVFNFLIDHGANVNLQTENGVSALMLRSKFVDPGVMLSQMEALIKHGAKADLKDRNGRTALFYAAEAVVRENADASLPASAAEYLVKTGGAQVNVTDSEGYTPLMVAAGDCNLATVKKLVQLGVNPSIKSKSGDTASILALTASSKQYMSSNAENCNQVVAYLKNPTPEQAEPAKTEKKVAYSTKPFQDILKEFQKDKTTLNEVVSQLGDPISQERGTNGDQYLYYGGASAPFNTVKSVPVQAIFKGTSDMPESFVAVFIFNTNGVMTGYSAVKMGGPAKH